MNSLPPSIAKIFRRLVALLCMILIALPAHAEQMKQFGQYEVHYIAIPTTFLQPEVAHKYNLTRASNRLLINVSILDQGDPVAAQVTGLARNLLSQSKDLTFTEVREGPAIYYIASMTHSAEDHQNFEINVTLPDGSQGQVKFHQKVFLGDE